MFRHCMFTLLLIPMTALWVISCASGGSPGRDTTMVSRTSGSSTEIESPLAFNPIKLSKESQPIGAGVAQAQQLLSASESTSNDKSKPSATTEDNHPVSVIDAITAPFTPGRNGCSLPGKIAKRLKETKDWAPEELRLLADAIKVQNVIPLNRKNINVLLSTISLQEGAQQVKVVVMGGESYQSLNPTPFIDRVRSNFAYTLDCSGYLNAAVSAAGGVGSLEMKAAASTALAAKRSVFVAYASVFPPIAIALAPSRAPAHMLDALPPRNRLDMLYALNASMPSDVSDSAKIVLPLIVEVLWTSSGGDSSFQGQASFSASGGASFGIGSISAKGDAGLSVARTSNYANFETYLMNTETTSAEPTSVIAMRKKLQDGVNDAAVLREPTRVNNRFEFTLDLPKQLCESTSWSAQGLTAAHVIVGSVSNPIGNSNGCLFTMLPQAPQTIDTLMTSGRFLLAGTNGKLVFGTTITL